MALREKIITALVTKCWHTWRNVLLLTFFSQLSAFPVVFVRNIELQKTLGFILRGAGLFQLTSSCFRPGYEQAHEDALPEHRLQYTGPVFE